MYKSHTHNNNNNNSNNSNNNSNSNNNIAKSCFFSWCVREKYLILCERTSGKASSQQIVSPGGLSHSLCTMIFMHTNFKFDIWGAEETIQWLRTHTAFAENPSPVLSTRVTVSYNSSSKETLYLLLILGTCIHLAYTHTAHTCT